MGKAETAVAVGRTLKAWVDVALGAMSEVEVDGGVLLDVGIVVTVEVGEKV